jgi:hypothetical protein
MSYLSVLFSAFRSLVQWFTPLSNLSLHTPLHLVFPPKVTGLKPMWDILSRSETTIDTFSFPSKVTEQATYLQLFGMRFPVLRSLTLGGSLSEIPSDKFSDFVLAHDHTLEELDMEYVHSSSLKFDDLSLREDSLPHLCSFRGGASTLTAMIQARMNCLTNTLRRLIVGTFRRRDGLLEMKCMFDAMLAFHNGGGSGSARRFSVLREIELDMQCLWGDEEGLIHAIDCIQKCAACFGSSLEVMTLMVPSRTRGIKTELLCELFGHFDKLKVIRLLEETFEGRMCISFQGPRPGTYEYKHNKGIVESCLRSIASNCWALEEIIVRRYPPCCQDDRWIVTRSQNPTMQERREVCELIRHEIKEVDVQDRCRPWDSTL